MKNRSFLLLFASLFVFLFSSCEEINFGKDDENSVDSSYGTSTLDAKDVTVASIEGQLQEAMNYLIDTREHKYQYQRNLNVDVFAGYLALCHDFDGRQPSTYYYPNNPFISGVYGEAPKLYSYVSPAILFGAKLGRPDLAAIGNIMYCYSMSVIVDAYGPVAYYDWRNLKTTHPLTYISAEEAYDAIISDLVNAVDTLKKYQPTPAQLVKVEGVAIGSPCEWQWTNWVKLANSLQLRMALNISNVKPAVAQSIAERVVNDEVGVLEYEDNDIGFKSYERKLVHPLYKISCGWVDTRLNATFENILKRYNHPALEVYFKKNGLNKDAVSYTGLYNKAGKKVLDRGKEYIGIRQGLVLRPQANDKDYLTFSELTQYSPTDVTKGAQYMNFSWIKTAEVLFLRAEGALRGWNMGGTAKEFYEYGIQKGLEDIGRVSEYSSYITRVANTEINYIDYYDTDNNINGRVTVSVKWDESDNNEVKLEKIITQKYIANFPMSMEAWTTYRRTGYPRQFPVCNNQWGYSGRPDNELGIRRIPWGDQPSTDEEIDTYYNYLLPKFENGINAANNPIFWDISASWTKGPDGQVIPQNNL